MSGREGRSGKDNDDGGNHYLVRIMVTPEQGLLVGQFPLS